MGIISFESGALLEDDLDFLLHHCIYHEVVMSYRYPLLFIVQFER